MRVIFAGTPANAATTLIALKSSGVDIVGVLTRTDAVIGRKKILTPSPVAEAAEALNIPVIKANQVDQETLERVVALNADLGVVVAYGTFLNEAALSSLPKGWINLHYSLLPALRGAAPVQHALLQGLSSTGVTAFQLDLGMDTGPVLLQAPTTIEQNENAGRLLSRLTELGISVLLEILPAIAAGIAVSKTQDGSAASFAPKISRVDAQLDWSESAERIENKVRAMNPEPMAWTSLEAESFRVIEARAWSDSATDDLVGSVQLRDNKVLVRTASGSLELITVQAAGKNEMSASDWFRGVKNKENVVFGS
jgi:methionyl-tRNA formyltransferase